MSWDCDGSKAWIMLNISASFLWCGGGGMDGGGGCWGQAIQQYIEIKTPGSFVESTYG